MGKAARYEQSETMQVLELNVADLRFDPRNAKKHGEESIQHIAKSLKEFGQQKPVIVSPSMVVMAGNGTLAAAKALEWTTIKGVVTELTGKQLKAYALADNKTAEYAGWDFSVLRDVIEELDDGEYDLTSTGFDQGELERIMGWVASEPLDEIEEDPQKRNSIICPNCKHEFEP